MRQYIFHNTISKRKILRFAGIFSIISLIGLIVFLFIPELLMARPGGGQSYSGGSGSSGGDGIAGLIIWLILQLPPQISIPLIIVIIVFYYFKNKKEKGHEVTIASNPTYANKFNEFNNIEQSLEQFKQKDPDFSRLLFWDFVSSIYHKYYSYIGKPDFKNIKPFIAPYIWEQVQNNPLNKQTDISEIVIGNINFISVFEDEKYTGIVVDIKSNYTKTKEGKSTRFVLTERWMFNRKKGILSKPPEEMRDLKCPNCGAPADFNDAGECQYCNTFITAGEMQWSVNQITIIKQEVFNTKGLAHYEQEIGTDYPTVISPVINTYITAFVQKHKLKDWDSYWQSFTDNIAYKYFSEIYDAWSEMQWQKVRHLLSDRLYESYNFWIEAYKREHLQNRLDNLSIKKIDMAAIETDKYYEAFTVRIFASCYDYVVNREGKIIGGSKKKARYFSEYWTFMRRSGVDFKESEFSLHNCPNCGAPADKMGQAAVCEYCGAKISNGDFSWILTRIVQDEEYTS